MSATTGSLICGAILTLLISASLYAQSARVMQSVPGSEVSEIVCYRSSWAAGFGAAYPRFVSISSYSYPGDHNLGFYFSAQRNFTEKVSFRALINYLHIESHYYPNGIPDENLRKVQRLNMFSTNLSLLYYFEVISPVRPFFSGGLGIILFDTEQSPDKRLNDQWFLKYQLSMGMGAEWRLKQDWRLKTEFKYHTASSSRLDGEDNPFEEEKGLLGGNTDTYISLDVGLLYYFSFTRTCVDAQGY